MSCDSKIDSFFSKSKGLLSGLSYGLYKEISFGNTKKVKEYEKYIQDIKSISWLFKKHERSTCSCSPVSCLCSGASADVSFNSEEFIDNTLDINGPPTTWPELWKGVLKNSKSGKVISVSSRALDVYDSGCEIINGTGASICRLNPNTHKSLRFWEWNDNVPTLLFDTGEIFNGIQAYEVVSFYYSELHDSYYVRVEDSVDGSLLFKVSSDFSNVEKKVLNASANPQAFNPVFVISEVVDSLNYIFVNTPTNIEVYSLADLSLIKTISTSGVSFQKMTWDEGNCSLFLTGGGDSGNAVVHVVDVIAGTITNLLNSTTLKNNTSIITRGGKLLVLTSDNNSNELVLQEWNTCTHQLLNSVSTGINMAIGPNPGFATIHTLTEDREGNIFVVYLPAGGNVTLSVFDKDFNLRFTRDLNWGTGSNNINNSWTNTNIIDGGHLVMHRIQQNGLNGIETYYLDFESKSLETINPACVVLTEEEITALANKINSIPKIKKYNTPTGGINSNISFVDCCNKLFVFKQLTPATSWLIIHNLDTFPVITTVDTSGNKILGTEVYIDNNTVRIDFTSPVAGVAYLTYNIQ